MLQIGLTDGPEPMLIFLEFGNLLRSESACHPHSPALMIRVLQERGPTNHTMNECPVIESA